MTNESQNNPHNDPVQQEEASPSLGGTSAGAALMHGHLQKEPRGFWADAWMQVLGRPGAVLGIVWVSIVAFCAIYAPFIANGHPIVMWEVLHETGERGEWTSPLLRYLTSIDVLLAIGGIVVPLWILLPTAKTSTTPERALKSLVFAGGFTTPIMFMLAGLTNLSTGVLVALGALMVVGLTIALFPVVEAEKRRSDRLVNLLYVCLLAGLIATLSELIAHYVERRTVSDFIRSIERSDWFVPVMSSGLAFLAALLFSFIPIGRDFVNRLLLVFATAAIAGSIVYHWWQPPVTTYEYREMERAGTIEAVYTIIPLSPDQRQMELRLAEPGDSALVQEYTKNDDGAAGDNAPRWPIYVLGSDTSGQDVLAQLLHACRLAISIGIVATGIAAIIGVTLGSLMGYFGGWVDLMLYRLVEIFMAVPLLFLLIVAAAVLPRNIYIMMAIIGCFTWHNAARFTRAEFYRLRDQDFVQAARALGLPMRSVLFRHMLPNGITPVLVEASFAVAAAILFESILSYLGLGPEDQASWGRLLSDAFADTGAFSWWLAIFPGLAIFLTVLSLTLVGEALRDAIDPKLKKAANA